MARGRIKAHSKKRRPGNSQQATSHAHDTPIIVATNAVPKTKRKEPKMYLPSTVYLICSQFSE